VKITALEIPGVMLVVPTRFDDARGYFSELYNAKQLEDAGIRDVFVQDNLSRSTKSGTIRGLHFQAPPYAQAKLVRVGRGRILDVVVDLRPSSPSYKAHICIEISAEDGALLYVPEGLAHGFCTLEPDTEVVYKASAYYAPQAERGILWSDPELGIKWPVSMDDVTISEKDSKLPHLKDLGKVF
jgi:dTDP-4-dehydrorhamnose 3,5-epimerase